jgi:hypothetical protein
MLDVPQAHAQQATLTQQHQSFQDAIVYTLGMKGHDPRGSGDSRVEAAPTWIATLGYDLKSRTKVYNLVVSDGKARADLKTCHDQSLHLVTPITLATTTEPGITVVVGPIQQPFRWARIKKKPTPKRRQVPCRAKRRLFRCCGTFQDGPLRGQQCEQVVTDTVATSCNDCPHHMCVDHTHHPADRLVLVCDHGLVREHAFRWARVKLKPTHKKIPWYSTKRRLFQCCGTLLSEPTSWAAMRKNHGRARCQHR